MKSKKNLILAMETAIAGGSLSISDGTSEIDFWIGTDEISKAEDVLEGIAGLLEKNKITGEQIATVAVSSGVGGATGLKIGSATAKGLAKALGCCLLEISLWDALAVEADRLTGQSAAVFLPHGKNAVCFREMKNQKIISETEILSLEGFMEKAQICLGLNEAVFAHSKIISEIVLGQCGLIPIHIHTLRSNLSTYITKSRLITN